MSKKLIFVASALGILSVCVWQFDQLNLLSLRAINGVKFISPNVKSLGWTVGFSIDEILPPIINIGDSEPQWIECLELADFTKKAVRGVTDGSVRLEIPVVFMLQFYPNGNVWDAYVKQGENILRISNGLDFSGRDNDPNDKFCEVIKTTMS